MVARGMILAALACVLITVVFAGFWLFTDHSDRREGLHICYRGMDWPTMLFTFLLNLLAAPPAIWLTAIASEGSAHLRSAAAFALWNWGIQVVQFCGAVGMMCEIPYLPYERAQTMAQVAWIFTTCAMIGASLKLAVNRARALETGALRSLGFSAVMPLVRAALVVVVFAGTAFVFQSYLPGMMFFVIFGVSALCCAVITICIIFVFFRGFRSALRGIHGAGKRAPGGYEDYVGQVHNAVRLEVAVLTFSLITTLFSLGMTVLWGEAIPIPDEWHASNAFKAIHRLVQLADLIGNDTAAVVVSGALAGAARSSVRRTRLAKQRQRRRNRAALKWVETRADASPEQEEWDGKVQDLAGRGISVSALLDFYKKLPQVMEHFDGSRHRTADIVTQVIVPMSSDRACAAAEVIMGNSMRRPDKMVTHNWANLFRDLVAAVLADALNESEFRFLAHLLDTEICTLEQWVDQANVGSRSYWICAFAVNQHAGVCSSNGKRKDSVTKMLAPACNCGLAKAWNDTPPLLPDGRSVPCEMNKFDDMMRFLAGTDPCFSQVLAVDAQFKTFSRAWCVAELATANEVGMHQDIKIISAAALAEHGDEMHSLRIQDMEASRKEDKEAILANIEDHDHFNLELQKMLFEDLFPTWSSLDAQEKMEGGGRIIRWQETSAWMRTTTIAEKSFAPAYSTASNSSAVTV